MKLNIIYHQQGVALAMLLWFLAGMTILVAGIVAQSKTDIKLVQLQLQQLQAESAGDGASLLLLREMLLLKEQGEFTGRGIIEQSYSLGEHEVAIRAVPVTGLIDLNRATASLLSALFSYGAELDVQQADELATNVLIWRGEEELGGILEDQDNDLLSRHGQFIVIEDLLQVEGINRNIFDRVARLVTVSQQGHDGIDILSAPEDVLLVLAEGSDSQVANIVTQRAENPYQDTGFGFSVNEEHISSRTLPVFRLDAKIRFNDGKTYRRTRWVTIGVEGVNGLPWRFFRTEPVVAINKDME